MRIITRSIACALMLAWSFVATAEEQPPAEVMLFGTFHFANPGRDVVKTDQIDVMTDENQVYLETLAERISKFNPTVVLLEFSPERDSEMQDQFEQYIAGSYKLPGNEIYQLGFRIAATSEADTIHGFDETSVHWRAEPLFEYLESKDTETSARMSSLIEKISVDTQEAQNSLSLQKLLMRANDTDQDALNRAIYATMLAMATISSEPTQLPTGGTRNFRMYALVQRYAQPGERVLAIGGQGHVAILRQLLADDRDRESVDIRRYLQ